MILVQIDRGDGSAIRQSAQFGDGSFRSIGIGQPGICRLFAHVDDGDVHVGAEASGSPKAFQPTPTGGCSRRIDQNDADGAPVNDGIELRPQSGMLTELVLAPATRSVFIERLVAEHDRDPTGEVIRVGETRIPIGAVFDCVPNKGCRRLDGACSGVAQHIERRAGDQIRGSKAGFAHFKAAGSSAGVELERLVPGGTFGICGPHGVDDGIIRGLEHRLASRSIQMPGDVFGCTSPAGSAGFPAFEPWVRQSLYMLVPLDGIEADGVHVRRKVDGFAGTSSGRELVERACLLDPPVTMFLIIG